VASGALSFESAVEAIAKRSAAMQADCNNNPGAMAAIMGLAYEKIVEVLKEIDGIVVPANFNSAEEIVISGEQAAVETACAKLKEAGAKLTKMLPVAGAYHSPLMKNSAETMREYIMQMEFGAFDFPIYANVSGEAISDAQHYRELLARQITSPVLWYPTMQNIYRDGIRKIVEIGPGKVLQKLAKRSFDDPSLEISGIDTLDDLDKFMNDYAKAGANEPG
jgi:[acyl-carrier-protein] S-malonyltransferase